MNLLFSLVLFTSLGYNVLAAPFQHRSTAAGHKKRSFRVERIKHNDYVRNSPGALSKAYNKFGITAYPMEGGDQHDFEPFFTASSKSTLVISDCASPASPSTTADTAEEGTVSATSVKGGSEYVSPVLIGGQNITMDFDTGSADMWVMNTELPSSMTEGHTLYNASESSTYKNVTGEFKIAYGDLSYASGSLAKDTVSIGGAEVKNQVFGLPTKVSSSFISDTYSNGMVGLSFSSINSFDPGPQKTFFDNIAPDLELPVFTSLLRSEGGLYEFGTIDHSLYTGKMRNISVDSSNGFWQFNTTGYGVNSNGSTTVGSNSTAICDTGTTLMLVTPDIVSLFYSAVNGSGYLNSVGGYVYPCDTDLPDLTIGIGHDMNATIPGSALGYEQVGTNTTTGKTICYGGVQSSAGSDFQIFGDIFLKAFYVVFDQRGPSLGIAYPSS
ncbi:aspergillopepsin A-like aspartic endopeptidase [Penicillium longicatenatum]|uniref:aspergillopepsin A-like aspartic endopeptidase n=1 Tax=Penicillium longicatenatum TaxID=1561947 RepID=UPI0025484042|nr:aspergillopepsin A-like aspartic endopeptidase [Penicillium longicatenatum]KAJ5636430.1 aspergillopepsin A-like aspartic endopeptidase [Penicillium longicatenatum]